MELVEKLPEGKKEFYMIKNRFKVARDSAGRVYLDTANGWAEFESWAYRFGDTVADLCAALARHYLFTDPELLAPKDWADYKNKAHYLYNIRTYFELGGVLSWYQLALKDGDKTKTADEQAAAAGLLGFSPVYMCYFKDQETADRLDALAVKQYAAIKTVLLNDPAKFKKAIRAEMFNYEAPLSYGGEGYTQALAHCLGCKFDDLTPEYKEIFKKTAHEVRMSYDW